VFDATRAPRRRRLLAASILLAGTLATPAAALTTREQNELEVNYLQLAEATGLLQFCERIYPGATGGAGFNPRGSQTWYTRSLCYYQLAIATGEPKFCDEVRPRSTLLQSGADYSAPECRKKVAPHQGQRPQRGQYILVEPVLRQMGYTEEMIPPKILRAASADDMWLAFFDSVAGTPDFAARIARLPDFSHVATQVQTTQCEPPMILGGIATGSLWERECCLDVNSNGLCDKEEFGHDPARGQDLEVEVTPGMPPRNLCGDGAFDVEVVIRNKGPVAVRAGAGHFSLAPINEADFGLTKADFYQALPAIPPGGAVRMRFQNLRYRVAWDGHGEREYPQAFVCLTKSQTQECQVVKLGYERRTPDEKPCLADASLRLPSGPCEAPYLRDPEPAAGRSACCLDVDRDRRCDDREWATSRARHETISIALPRNPAPTLEEGVPYYLPVRIRNQGTTPIGPHDGFVRLEHGPTVTVAHEWDLVLPLPDIAPGKEAMVIFPGLRFVAPETGIGPFGDNFWVTLCLRSGCSYMDGLLVTLMPVDLAQRQTAAQRPARATSAVAPGPRKDANGRKIPWPIVGPDGSTTRSTLDPQAFVAVGQPAPDFSTSDSQGRFFRLLQLRGKKNAVLVFCPGSGSAPGCAARLASLQQVRTTLARLDTQVFVVSERGGGEPAAVRQAAGPEIEWLADMGLRISECYARHAAGETGALRPMVVIVDKQGKVLRAVDDPRGTQPPTLDILQAIEH
jgi:peroxiredoxin